METEKYIREGMDPQAARTRALRNFGPMERHKEEARETRGVSWLEELVQDLRYGARTLVKYPGFAAMAVLTLGLGIGANTSMFSVYNGIALKPLPYADVARLQRVYRGTPQNPEGNISPADFLALQNSAAPYGEVAALTDARVNLSDVGQPAELVLGARASTNLFSLLGVTMQLGRAFAPGEDTPGRGHLVILSDRVWRHRYAADPDIVGRQIRVEGEPHTVVGVLPPFFNDWRHLGYIDLFRPFRITPSFAADHQANELEVIGRPAPTLALADADAWLAQFGAQRARDFPEANSAVTWQVVPLQSTVVRGAGGNTTLTLLIGLSGFVLLIACSNLANLLLARTLARAREFAVRGALGASRLQLLRPLAAESLLLSLAGGALAIFAALWFRDWIAVRSTGDNGETVWLAFDWKIFAWTFVASCLTALAFGLAPALFALRLDLNATLKSGGRGAAGGRTQQRIRELLIVGQFALATVLLAGAAVFIRGLDDLQHRRSGWQSARVVVGSLSLPVGSYDGDAQRVAFQRLALERLQALPGVESAALATAAPFFSWGSVTKFQVAGHPIPAAGHEPAAMIAAISPRYLDTFSMRLLSGRTFLERDRAGAPLVFLISETTARAFFGAADPVGQRLALLDGATPRWGEIVGVVAEFETVDAEPSPIAHRIYQPLEQAPPRSLELAVRVAPTLAPAQVIDSVRSAIAALNADLPVRHLQPADAFIERTVYQLGVMRDILASFGLLGLALASLGIYGVIARTTAQRTNEFAVRLALGATVRDIDRLVFSSGIRLALIGSLLGLAGAIALTRLLISQFPGLHANSPAILITTMLLLVAVALVACWLPARRAGKVNAILALRAE